MLAILNSLNAHNLPIFQPILMILVSKFMVHRALSDKALAYLSLGLLSPLKTGAIFYNFICVRRLLKAFSIATYPECCLFANSLGPGQAHLMVFLFFGVFLLCFVFLKTFTLRKNSRQQKSMHNYLLPCENLNQVMLYYLDKRILSVWDVFFLP